MVRPFTAGVSMYGENALGGGTGPSPSGDASPAVLNSLRAGDHVVLCFERDTLGGEDRLALPPYAPGLLPFLLSTSRERFGI